MNRELLYSDEGVELLEAVEDRLILYRRPKDLGHREGLAKEGDWTPILPLDLKVPLRFSDASV